MLAHLYGTSGHISIAFIIISNLNEWKKNYPFYGVADGMANKIRLFVLYIAGGLSALMCIIVLIVWKLFFSQRLDEIIHS